MNVAVACGGTGGHIFPGLATARVLQARGHAVTLWLAGRDVEACSVADWQGATVHIRAAGLPAGLSLRAVTSLWRMAGAVVAAWRRLRETRPDVLLCMGSYASVGPCLAARLLGIPVVLHEANAVPGRAISLLARFAPHVAVGFEAALAWFPPRVQTDVTGFPLREGFRAEPKAAETGNMGPLTLLVMGGSQGAHALNARMPAVAAALQAELDRPVRIIHLAGRHEAEAVAADYRKQQVEAEVHAFVADMASLYARADVAVARAGAASCTELAVCGVPAVLVPLPHAPRNHQMRNAEAMAESGGMLVMPESEFSVENMVQRLAMLFRNPDGLQLMRETLFKAVPADGAQRLATLVEDVAG